MLLAFLCGEYAFAENANELVGFVKKGGEQDGVFDEWDSFDETEPAPCFAQFLEADFEFVNEVVGGFRLLGFTVVGTGRCSRT